MYKISPTIDSKVFNKKVAVDDSFGARGVQRPKFAYEGGTKKTGTWSCVDYEDTNRIRNIEAMSRGAASNLMTALYRAPELGGRENTLSIRFKDPEESELKQENGLGNCRGIRDVARWERVNCDGSELSEEPRGDGKGAIKVRWWTGKQTNRGWPDTGAKTNDTAHGIANDLKTKLNKEQRNTVAGLLSKTISGAEVVEICALLC